MGYKDLEETIKMLENERKLMGKIKSTGAEVLLDVSLAIESVRKQIQYVPNGYEVLLCAAAIEKLVLSYERVMGMLED